jgi:hypothetical protein
MAITLIDLINKVLLITSQRDNKTVIAETDSTKLVREYINEALSWIYDQYPTQVDADGTGTLTTARTITPPTGLDPYRVYDWSWRIQDSAGDIPIDFVTEQFIINEYPSYETDTADNPKYVYLTNGLFGFYPLLASGTKTIKYKYPANSTALTATAATFPFPDESPEMKFIKLYARLQYEVDKGLGQPGVTNDKVEDLQAMLIAKYAKAKRKGFTSSRKYY